MKYMKYNFKSMDTKYNKTMKYKNTYWLKQQQNSIHTFKSMNTKKTLKLWNIHNQTHIMCYIDITNTHKKKNRTQNTINIWNTKINTNYNIIKIPYTLPNAL